MTLFGNPPIIVYNLAGLLVGAAGLVLGLALFVLTNRVGVGALTLAVVWMVLGFLWRSWKTSPGQLRPYPAVYFIPLPFLAIPIVPLAFLLLVVEQRGSHGAAGPGGATAADDPRAALLREDESSLDRARLGGDLELSEQLATRLSSTLSEGAKADAYHIFTRVNPENVLVLIKAPNLKSYKENARVQLLHAVGEILSEDDGLKAKKVYIGVKGRIAFGAIQVPPGRVETGSVLRDSPLRDFYGPMANGAGSSGSGAVVITGVRSKDGSWDHAPLREPVQARDAPGRSTPEVAPEDQTGGPSN